jgi:glycosyltransferase involved in cell wall biosynthesis
MLFCWFYLGAYAFMLSVIIIAKNEGSNLRRCLESIRWADEIILLDSGSTDNTLSIAREYTDKIITTDWQGYGIQKQRALEQATGTWVLNLDADESVSQPLKEAILDAIKQDKADAFRVPIYLNFYGKSLTHSWCPKRHIRLYKREGAHYTDKIVHEGVLVPAEARIGKLEYGIEHHSFQDISHALYKMNKYSSYSAKIRNNANKKFSLFRSLIHSASMFFRCYFLQGGFLEGRDGFLLAVLSAHGSFYRGIKTLYQDNDGNSDKIP